LLDLLESETGARYDDLWRTWVARPTDLPLLDQRTRARARYDAVVAQAGDWPLPRPVRDAMRNWRFDEATALLDQAAAVLDARARVDAATARAGLIAPAALQLAFEDADGFEDASAEAAAELETIQRYEDAVALRPTGTDVVRDLGLWGEAPEADLVAARQALAKGDLEQSVAASSEAAASWSHASAVGQGRALSIGLLIVAGLLAIGLFVGTIRRRRRTTAMAHPISR
jgi:hypothetical protein